MARGRPKNAISKKTVERLRKELAEKEALYQKRVGPPELPDDDIPDATSSWNIEWLDKAVNEVEVGETQDETQDDVPDEDEVQFEDDLKEEGEVHEHEDDTDNILEERLQKLKSFSNKTEAYEDSKEVFEDDVDEDNEELREKILLMWVEFEDDLKESFDKKNYTPKKVGNMKRPELVRTYKAMMKKLSSGNAEIISTLYFSGLSLVEVITPKITSKIKLSGLSSKAQGNSKIHKYLKLLDVKYARTYEELCEPEYLLLLSTLGVAIQTHNENNGGLKVDKLNSAVTPNLLNKYS